MDWSWEKAKYSINKGLWGTSVGGSETLKSHEPLPDSAYPSDCTKTAAEKISLHFDKGELVGINNTTYSPVEAIQQLQRLAGAFAIGRDIHVGDTIIGIKGRVGFEAAAALVSIKAHQLLEKHTLSKWQLHHKDYIGSYYGMMLHEGQYLDPVMRDFEALLSSSQQTVTGTVFVTLHPYRFTLDGIESKFDLMDNSFGTYGEANEAWTADEAKGFINYRPMPEKFISMSINNISVGVVGGAGYTGGELLRLLVLHPNVNIDFIYSTTRAGKAVSETHTDLIGVFDMSFSAELNQEVDVLFLCLGHGNSAAFLHDNVVNDNTKIIDLSNDFRLKDDHDFMGRSYVYGLTEVNKKQIKSAQAIANPGCFATAIQLALVPLAAAKKLSQDVHINAITGSTGAGAVPAATSHFSWRNNNISYYKPFVHQHLGEIGETIAQEQGSNTKLHFLPIRGNFTRGIFATAYTLSLIHI